MDRRIPRGQFMRLKELAAAEKVDYSTVRRWKDHGYLEVRRIARGVGIRVRLTTIPDARK